MQVEKQHGNIERRTLNIEHRIILRPTDIQRSVFGVGCSMFVF